MSIIINGMNMPKGNSTKNVLIYSDGTVFTGHKDDANYSAEERKKGKWIIEKDATGATYGRCSVCGIKQYGGHMNFCYECGTDMRGEQDEQQEDDIS